MSAPDLRRGWMLGLFTTIYTFGFIDRMVVSVLGQPIKAELGLTDLQLGLVGGLTFAVFNAVVSLPVARLAERANRIGIISIGVALWSAATMLCGAATGFLSLVIARLGVGVGEAVVPTTNSVISDYYPRERRASALSIYLLAVPIGAFAGAALGGFVAQAWGWRMAFVAAGAPGLLLALLLRLTVAEPPRGQYDPPGAAAETPPLVAVLKRMAGRPSMVLCIAGATVASAGGYGINFFLAPYFMRGFGMELAQAGLLSGLISALPGVLSMLAGGFLTDFAARRDARFYAWLPAIGLAATFPLYLVSLLQGAWPAAVAMLMVTGLMQYAYIPATAAVVQNQTQPRMRASAAAIYGLITNLVGLGLGPLIVGGLSDVFAARAGGEAAGLQWAMIAAASLYVGGAALYFLAGRTMRRDLEAA